MDKACGLKRVSFKSMRTPSNKSFAGRSRQTIRAGSVPYSTFHVKPQPPRWATPFRYQLINNDMDVENTQIIEPIDKERAGTSKDLIRPPKNKKIAKYLLLVALVALILALILALALHFALLRSHSKQQLPLYPEGPKGGVPTSSPNTPPTSSPNRPMTSTLNGPVITSNFADPCFIDVNGMFYAFATNKYVKPQPGQVHIQLATSSDFQEWNLTRQDALPDVGGWATGAFVWAPDVIQLDDGSFVMYYSAQHVNATKLHCVGAATSKTVEGPYSPLTTPLACPLDQGGAIDPDGFKDIDGSRYMIYKVDGNSLNNLTHTLHPTPLMLQKVNSTDGITLIGDPIQLLDRSAQDGPLIEAPTMARYDSQDGESSPVYVLFYSSNVFTTRWYDVSYATSTTGLKGPYTKSGVPLLVTGDDGGKLFGPGGLDVGLDGQKVVFHSGIGGSSIVRTLWTGSLSVNKTVISI